MAGRPGPKPLSGAELLAADWNSLSIRARRRRVLEEANYACVRCGFNTRRIDGHSIIEIDHIDGDNQNNSRENLRALCPNCHALTPNFRAFGRSNKVRTSTVPLRPGNREYRQIEQLLERMLPNITSMTDVEFATPGWTLRLHNKLQNMHPTYPLTSQMIARFLKKHAPVFYNTTCYHVKRERSAREE